MQQLQHTVFIMFKEQALSAIGYWFAPLSLAATGNKYNNDIKRPKFKRYEA